MQIHGYELSSHYDDTTECATVWVTQGTRTGEFRVHGVKYLETEIMPVRGDFLIHCSPRLCQAIRQAAHVAFGRWYAARNNGGGYA